jgi:hypothetical protein
MAKPRACAKSERWRRSKRRKPLKRQQQNKVTRKQNTAKLTACASEFCGVLFLTVLVAGEPICGKWGIQYENPASLDCSSSQRLPKSEIPPHLSQILRGAVRHLARRATLGYNVAVVRGELHGDSAQLGLGGMNRMGTTLLSQGDVRASWVGAPPQCPVRVAGETAYVDSCAAILGRVLSARLEIAARVVFQY